MNNNLHKHEKSVSLREKSKRNHHNPCVVWLTGLSGSGKSTIGNSLERRLFNLGLNTHMLDGDNVRMGLNSDLDFSSEGRKENIRRVGEVANLFAQSGTIIITAFISPYREDRRKARSTCTEKFLEVFLDPGLSVCESRDPKGLYSKARTGEIKNFTGIDAPYEEPDMQHPGVLRVDTGVLTVDECVDAIIEKMKNIGVFFS
jgi:adenylylsulfate kinase